MAMYSRPCRYQLHARIRMHHISSIPTRSMLASNTHASHQQPALLLICFCYQQLQSKTVALRRGHVSPGNDGNPAHFAMIEARMPTTDAEAALDATRTSWGRTHSNRSGNAQQVVLQVQAESREALGHGWPVGNNRSHVLKIDNHISD